MTYRSITQFTVQCSAVLIGLLFSWVTYHQTIDLMHGDAMTSSTQIDCIALCLVSSQMDLTETVQAVYYFLQTASLLVVLVASLLVTVKWIGNFFQRNNTLGFQTQRSYYHQQSWQYQLHALWAPLFSQGIIAPQVYS